MKRYAEYKDSGIKWLGKIPSHWEVHTLRNFLKLVSIKGCENKPLLSVTREQGVIERNIESKEENHNFIPDDLSGYKLVKKGQFVINKMKSWQGAYAVSEYEGIVSPAYYVCDLNYEGKNFFSTAIRSKAYIPFFAQYSKGIRVGQWDLSPIALKSIPFFVPPIEEQAQIAHYLKVKTSKIDKYVTKRERERERFESLKQAEIANVVTKGLNPDVPMKDSGIPWLGMIPAHWEIKPFGQYFTFGKGLPITKADLQPNGIAVISYGQIHAKNNKCTSIPEELVRYVSEDFLKTHPQCLLRKNDFVFADTSEDIEGSGNFAFNDRDTHIFAGYHTLIARHKGLSCPKYYAMLFQSVKWKAQVQSLVNGVKVFSVGRQILKKSYLLFPPLEEQQAIVEYIDSRIEKIDRYIAGLTAEIEYLKEFKQRLISDAVTGQIKVTD